MRVIFCSVLLDENTIMSLILSVIAYTELKRRSQGNAPVVISQVTENNEEEQELIQVNRDKI